MWETMKLKKVHVIQVSWEEREEQKKIWEEVLLKTSQIWWKKQSPHPRNTMNSKYHEHKEVHTQAHHSEKKMLERQRKNLKEQQEKND